MYLLEEYQEVMAEIGVMSALMSLVRPPTAFDKKPKSVVDTSPEEKKQSYISNTIKALTRVRSRLLKLFMYEKGVSNRAKKELGIPILIHVGDSNKPYTGMSKSEVLKFKAKIKRILALPKESRSKVSDVVDEIANDSRLKKHAGEVHRILLSIPLVKISGSVAELEGLKYLDKRLPKIMFGSAMAGTNAIRDLDHIINMVTKKAMVPAFESSLDLGDLMCIFEESGILELTTGSSVVALPARIGPKRKKKKAHCNDIDPGSSGHS